MAGKKIKKIVEDALTRLSLENADVNLELAEDLAHGDYTTNVALRYAKESGQNPKELAEKIASEILKDKPDEVERIEVASPGFVNFFLKPEVFGENVKVILKSGEAYGKNTKLGGQKTIIEYTDPNPFKEFHIGHLMSNTIGESIARIIESQGAEVKRANYEGDVGVHVAKAIWGAICDGGNDYKNIQAWGKAYALGARSYEEGEESKKEILEINKKIYDKSDGEINKLYDLGKRISLEYFESIYAKLGTKFDFYFFESGTGELGKKIVEENKEKIFESSDGAVIFEGENYGLHTRVFINSEGLPTYEAKELGLAKIKYERYPYDASIIITANEVDDYFKVLLKAMEFIFPDLSKKTRHLSHGILKLPTGKMSSRTGSIITAESLIMEIESLVKEKIKDRELSEPEKKSIVESVGVGAIKYSVLKQSIGGDIVFDFEKSISFEGNSGPYLQYTFARAMSVVRNADDQKITPSSGVSLHYITEVERMLYRFPEIVARAGEEFAPHYICTYLFDLAQKFNAYYAREKIVDAGDPSSPYKIAITKAVAIVIKNGLSILGINAPEKM